MAEAKAKRATREVPTWRELMPDFLPPPELITRAELLARFARDGVPLSERTLRHWEAVGALPRAVRQQHQGSVQAVYPGWFPALVATVGARREQGESLVSIATEMSALVARDATFFWLMENRHFPLDLAPEGRALLKPLEELMQRVGQTEERPVARSVIIMLDHHGKPVAQWHWPIFRDVVSDGAGASAPSDTAPSVAPQLSSPTDMTNDITKPHTN